MEKEGEGKMKKDRKAKGTENSNDT